MKARRILIDCGLRGALVACCLLAAREAAAQRVQFPTMVDASPPLSPVPPNPALSGGGGTFAPGAGAPPPTATAAPSLTPGWDPYASPAAQPTPPFQPQAPYSPYAPSPYAPPPSPYAGTPYGPTPYSSVPYSPAPQSLYPDGLQLPQFAPNPGFSQQVSQGLRFMQEARLRWTWMPSNGSHPLGINDVETSATFAVPFFRTSAPFLITPGFAMHFFDGPITAPPENADLPARTYDAYLDWGWHPQVTPWFGANLGVRVGAYTDFNTFNTHSIRIMGRGLGIVTLTPTVQVAAGVVYIDRLQIKLFPAGGIIWTPSPDARYEILFPNPKLARRWTTLGNTDIWAYVSGEYGGGSWTIQRSFGMGNDQADYNDIRVTLGLESYGLNGLHGLFEVGYVFQRQILYRSGTPEFNPSDTVMLRAGLSY